MPYALFHDGAKIKEADALPCLDQDITRMNERMEAGYEWRIIVEDETPAHEPAYQRVVVTEAKQTGKKLKKAKKLEDRADWQDAARAAITAKLNGYFSFQALARDLVMRTNGPAIARAQAAVAYADSLFAAIDRGEKPNLNAGWPA